MKYAIDGSNVLLDLQIEGKPSVRAFAGFLNHLHKKGDTYRLFFDNSVRRIMGERGVSADWAELESGMRSAGVELEFESHADPYIQEYCRVQNAALINSTDKLDSWRVRGPIPSVVHRARLVNRAGSIWFELRENANGQFVTQFPLPSSVTLGGVEFVARPGEALTKHVLTPITRQQRPPLSGTLLVFVLDASDSMNWTDTYDGKKKSEHLNEILRDCIGRLSGSRVGDGLYLAFLRFSDDVTPLKSPHGTEFAHVFDWQRMERFDYLEGVPMSKTNIRAALVRARELIQDALADRETLAKIAWMWRAVMILVTDGRHEVTRPDGTEETDIDVALAARDIHSGISRIYDEKDKDVRLQDNRISVGCVAIGREHNHHLLLNISSRCTEEQKRMLRAAQIQELLVEERLFITVDSKNPRYADAVRAFIDVASSSAR